MKVKRLNPGYLLKPFLLYIKRDQWILLSLFWNSTTFHFVFVLTWEMHLGRGVTYLLLKRPRAFYENLFTGDFSSWIYNGFQRNYSYCHNKCVQFIHFCSLTLLDLDFFRWCNILYQPLELNTSGAASRLRRLKNVADVERIYNSHFLTYRHKAGLLMGDDIGDRS